MERKIPIAGRTDENLFHLEKLDKELAAENADTSLDRKEGWGYSKLDAVNRYLPEAREQLLDTLYWFQFGSFESQHVWMFDKMQIRAILQQQAEDKWLHLCPAFNFRKVEKIVERLPDRINLDNNPNWKPLYGNVLEGSRIHRKATGIIHKITKTGASASNDDQPKGDAEETVRFIPKVSFEDIGGIDGIITSIREVIELPLKNPELFNHLGIKPHKGVLLYGPPGNGKTLIAKAIANETSAHFISVKGPELLNKYYGQSEENLRKLFEEARDLQPAIIFFDEIDSIAQSRSGAETLRMDARLVNQLLTLMDGIEDYGKVCVIAATNRLELIDDALLRPGRFDYQLKVSKPNRAGAEKIMKIATRNMPVDPGFSFTEFSPGLEGLSGADISFVAREGAYNCLRRSLDIEKTLKNGPLEPDSFKDLVISQQDFDRALKKLPSGSTKSDDSKTEVDVSEIVNKAVEAVNKPVES